MSHYFIDKHDPRVADLFRRLEKAGKALDKLESSGGRTLKGERFVTDEELSRLLKISRRTLQEYRTARIIPYYLIQGKVLYMESEIQKLQYRRHGCAPGGKPSPHGVCRF
ncbi:MAG: helix-turn-helix domain-containing protein [Bacteroides sp.]|nr:helix-turn-helix domain-containing protein [Bacteroides sp.]MDU1772086.1 helix-turn-helix domain-containing protein [Bacteroides sp.]